MKHRPVSLTPMGAAAAWSEASGWAHEAGPRNASTGHGTTSHGTTGDKAHACEGAGTC